MALPADHLVQNFYVSLASRDPHPASPSQPHMKKIDESECRRGNQEGQGEGRRGEAANRSDDGIEQKVEARTKERKKVTLHTSGEEVSKGKGKQGQFDKIFDMLTNKRAPSATVRTKLRVRRSNLGTEMGHSHIATQFQEYFQMFPEKTKAADLRQSRKKIQSRKKTLQTEATVGQEDAEEGDLFIKEMEKKLTYHTRMKRKIANKMDGLLKTGDTKMRRIEMIGKDEAPKVEKVLWLKTHSTKPAPKMKIIRSGLPVRLSELDMRTKTGSRTLLEDQRVRKDRAFSRTMKNSCNVVLTEISNFAEGKTEKESHHRSKAVLKDAHFMKATCSQTLKKSKSSTGFRKSLDDRQLIKWTEKCSQIEKDYKHDRKKSRQLSGGLKIFGNYCQFIDHKLSLDQDKLTRLMAENDGDRTRMSYHDNQVQLIP